MCQRQYSNCKYLESSSPFIFVSLINFQNSAYLSPTHPGFTHSVCLCLSTLNPHTLLTLVFMLRKGLSSTSFQHCLCSGYALHTANMVVTGLLASMELTVQQIRTPVIVARPSKQPRKEGLRTSWCSEVPPVGQPLWETPLWETPHLGFAQSQSWF